MAALIFKIDGFTRVIFFHHISHMGYQPGTLVIKTDDGTTFNIEGQHNIDALFGQMIGVMPDVIAQLRGEPSSPTIVLKFGATQNGK